ncbi:hypothetical protein N0V88_006269 [Collariella sp. IMI 366227]|nr:hypothetical protein N0V88_006269 [Collariella sp. IMI 366227]
MDGDRSQSPPQNGGLASDDHDSNGHDHYYNNQGHGSNADSNGNSNGHNHDSKVQGKAPEVYYSDASNDESPPNKKLKLLSKASYFIYQGCRMKEYFYWKRVEEETERNTEFNRGLACEMSHVFKMQKGTADFPYAT